MFTKPLLRFPHSLYALPPHLFFSASTVTISMSTKELSISTDEQTRLLAGKLQYIIPIQGEGGFVSMPTVTSFLGNVMAYWEFSTNSYH